MCVTCGNQYVDVERIIQYAAGRNRHTGGGNNVKQEDTKICEEETIFSRRKQTLRKYETKWSKRKPTDMKMCCRNDIELKETTYNKKILTCTKESTCYQQRPTRE
jgi:hypothetical protein